MAEAKEKTAVNPGEKTVNPEAGKFKLTVHKNDSDKSPTIQVGVNGKIYDIKRGVEVIVPHAVIEALTNAVKTIYIREGEEVIASSVPAYPFSFSPV